MAFFKFRKGGDESPATPSQPESVEAMRRRARHRLIGAAVLVLAGVIGFPLLFDTQPRPIAVDIPIEIPDRSKAKPLAAPAPVPAAAAPAVAAAPAAPAAVRPEEKLPPARTAPEQVATKTEAKAAPRPESEASVAKAEPKPDAKPEPKAAASADDGAKARALLEGKPVEVAAASPAAGAERFIVQVGAFADGDKAREARLKLEKAGLKTYTHVADTKDGKRTRVRVGPFATRSEADKAAERIKGLDLPAAILTL
ncbi:MAG TPA: SPOR domain-containing protein [Ramlibacter sp.]|nr:SPOR domain-containing protein [Ramlibacter sp.]